jgi:hypothetical protein
MGHGMTYEEAMDGAEVSRYEAEREIRRHHADPALFFAEMGEREMYAALDVLEWLGY